MAPAEANNTFPNEMKMTTWPSAPDLTPLKRQDRKRHTIFVCFRSSITKKHWEPDSNHPICYGCQRKFTFFLRRHHCRRCGKVFCFACSGLKMRLDENAQIGDEGYFHRVCFFCYKSKDSCIFNEQCFGKTTSLSRYFRKIRDKESLRSSFSLMADTSRHQFTAEVVELCSPLITIFMKKKSSGGLAKPVKAVGGALLKTGREAVCNWCQNNIHIPTNRMQCKLCKQIYCKKCSSKRLAIVSDGTSKDQFDILLTDSFEELQQKYTHCECYRSCLECENKVKILLDRANFDKTLDSLYREMHHIQFDISEALIQQDGGIRSTSLERDIGIEMSGLLETKDVNESFDLLTERDIMMEGSRISRNLINKFFDKYQTLKQLNSAANPTTHARTKLITNIKLAMHDYYFETKPKILKPNSHTVATTAI